MPQTKIQEKFYPLTVSITEVLRKAKLTAAEWRIWSYLVEIDPWGDRYSDFDYLSVISACDCSKSSFYRAIAKFQELKIFDFQARGFCFRNLTGISHWEKSESDPITDDSQPKPKPEAVSEMGKQSQNWENSLKNETPVSEMGKQSQNWENQELEPLSAIAYSSPQTFQTELDYPNQPDGGGQINFQCEEVSQERKLIKLNHQVSESKEVKEEQKHKNTTKTTEKKDLPRDVVQKNSKIPDDLLEKLRELTIPLDEEVLNAIASHHISQAYGAVAHIEDTWETINNPRSIFLFQVPKQKIEKLGQQLPEIGPQIREEYAAIEEEMASDEYQATSKEAFAKIREKLGKGERK